jgi:hypothetical protein
MIPGCCDLATASGAFVNSTERSSLPRFVGGIENRVDAMRKFKTVLILSQSTHLTWAEKAFHCGEGMVLLWLRAIPNWPIEAERVANAVGS